MASIYDWPHTGPRRAQQLPAMPFGEQDTTLGDTQPAPLDAAHASSELLGPDDEEAGFPPCTWCNLLPLAIGAALAALLWLLLGGKP